MKKKKLILKKEKLILNISTAYNVKNTCGYIFIIIINKKKKEEKVLLFSYY